MEYLYEVVYTYDNGPIYHPFLFIGLMILIMYSGIRTRGDFNKRRDNSVIPTIKLSNFWRIVLFSPGSLYIPPDETEDLLSVFSLHHIVMQVSALLLIMQGIVTIILYYSLGLQEHFGIVLVVTMASVVMFNFVTMFISRFLDRRNSKGMHYDQWAEENKARYTKDDI